MDEKDADELADQASARSDEYHPWGITCSSPLRNYVIAHTEGAHARGVVSLVPSYGLVRGRAGFAHAQPRRTE